MSEVRMEDFDTITRYLLQDKPKSIFDAGFGDLKWLEWCNKHNIEFEGIEIDPELVAKGKEKYPNHADLLHEGDLTESNILDEFPDNSTDVVLVIEVIEHIRHPDLVRKLLQQCARIAKKKVIITTPNCGDEDLLKKHGLIYHHYTHVATDGMKFTVDRAHRHWIRFTKGNLSELMTKDFTHFKVMEKRPIQILKVLCYDKLWAEINVEEETNGQER